MRIAASLRSCCTEGMASADQTPLAFGASVMAPKILCSLNAHRILTTAAPFRSLLPPLAALANILSQ